MTAKTRKGYRGHKTNGADKGTAHERLMRAHTSGARSEGAPEVGEPPEEPNEIESSAADEDEGPSPTDADDEDGEEAAEEDQS